MNERIRELAEQAGYNTKELDVQEQIVAGKFAELIVRECVSLCEDVKVQHRQYRMEETDFGMKNIYAEGEATCDVLQHKMKKHFGVEE